jgi:DNA-binding response OmpR family regulator
VLAITWEAQPCEYAEGAMARIIIAEDDEIIGEIARDALIAAGHGAGLVANGADALKVIRSRRPDLVILDCNMPGLSGVLLVQELRKLPELADLPVMMLTGRRSKRDEELARFAGANDYMTKPFDPDELVFRVEEMLARR